MEPSGPPNNEEVATAAGLVGRLARNMKWIMLGKPHVVLEDVPGVGKTTRARAMAASVQGQWRRIQFTPDLLPSDVTGVTIFNQASRGFGVHPGPVFANIAIGGEYD